MDKEIIYMWYPNFEVGGVTALKDITIKELSNKYEVKILVGIDFDKNIKNSKIIFHSSYFDLIRELSKDNETYLVGHCSFFRHMSDTSYYPNLDTHMTSFVDMFNIPNFKFICLTEFDYNYSQRFKFTNGKVIYGINPYEIKPKLNKVDEFSIGIVSRTSSDKGILHLSNILEELPKDLKVYVTECKDEDDEGSSYLNKCKKAFKDKVIWVDKNNPNYIYERAKAIISFAWTETAPVAWLEAVNYDIPVIMYDIPCPDYKWFNKSWIRVPYGYYHDIANIINNKLLNLKSDYLELENYLSNNAKWTDKL